MSLSRVFVQVTAKRDIHVYTGCMPEANNMAITRERKNTKRPYRQDRDPREKLFYLFLIAQICAIFGMVVGVLFFILRILTYLN